MCERNVVEYLKDLLEETNGIRPLTRNENGDVYLNGDALEWIARDNKIQIDGEWQPFGIEEIEE